MRRGGLCSPRRQAAGGARHHILAPRPTEQFDGSDSGSSKLGGVPAPWLKQPRRRPSLDIAFGLLNSASKSRRSLVPSTRAFAGGDTPSQGHHSFARPAVPPLHSEQVLRRLGRHGQSATGSTPTRLRARGHSRPSHQRRAIGRGRVSSIRLGQGSRVPDCLSQDEPCVPAWKAEQGRCRSAPLPTSSQPFSKRFPKYQVQILLAAAVEPSLTRPERSGGLGHPSGLQLTAAWAGSAAGWFPLLGPPRALPRRG